MDDPETGPAHRSVHTATPELRDTNEVEQDGVFEVRMPIATTGEVRNQGDDPLTRDELDGMARQIDDRAIGVFADHGETHLGGRGRYSAVEKLGEWQEGEVRTRSDEDGESELVATARLMNPEDLPNGVGDLRAVLGAIKEQVDRGMSLSSSIGWREDDTYPGGNDLMEASIVGIGADPRTTSDAPADVVARAAVDAGTDPAALVRTVRDAVADDLDADLPDTSMPADGSGMAAVHAGRNLDDPAFAEGDAVRWSFQGEPVHGRVADIGEEFTVSGNTISGDDGEAVYLIHEWDEDVEAFRDSNVAKPQSSLDESGLEMPAATDDNFASANDMTDDATADDGGTDESNSETTARDEAAEFRTRMLEMQEQQTEILQGLVERMGEDHEDDDEEEEDQATDDDEDEDEEDEQSTDAPASEQSADVADDTDDDGADLSERVAELEAELQAVRSGETDLDTPEGDTDTDADADADAADDEQRDTTAEKPHWKDELQNL